MIGTREIIILLVIVLLLFGPKQLPRLARSLGQSMNELKKGMAGIGEDLKDSMHDEKKQDMASRQEPAQSAAPAPSAERPAEPTEPRNA